MLREHALGKLRAKKTDAKEAISWLIEEGASLEALASNADLAARNVASRILADMGEDGATRAAGGSAPTS